MCDISLIKGLLLSTKFTNLNGNPIPDNVWVVQQADTKQVDTKHNVQL